jgi:hypothetical protein
MAASESPGRTVYVVPVTGAVVGAMLGEAVPFGDGVALGSGVDRDGDGEGDGDGANVPPTVVGVGLGVGVVAAGVAHAARASSSAMTSGPCRGWRIGQFG